LDNDLAKAKNIEERSSIIYQASKEGFSQDKLALLVGVSQIQISRIIKK